MNYAHAGDYGFTIDFTSQVDLTTVDRVVFLLKRKGGTAVQRELQANEFNTVGVGATLSVDVLSGDLPAPGNYSAQIVTRTETGGTGTSETTADVYEFEVKPRIANVAWS